MFVDTDCMFCVQKELVIIFLYVTCESIELYLRLQFFVDKCLQRFCASIYRFTDVIMSTRRRRPYSCSFIIVNRMNINPHIQLPRMVLLEHVG